MSLSGQWIANYTANGNVGKLVLDIDEVDDHYQGTALLWDKNSEHMNARVIFNTRTKEDIQKISGLTVGIINNDGNPVSAEIRRQILDKQGVIYPDTADVQLELREGQLHANWQSSHGGFGIGIASISKTRARQPSDLKVHEAKTWSEFKEAVNKTDYTKYAFRGQESSKWRLQTSFHRTGRANMNRYMLDDGAELQRIYSALSNHVFDLRDPQHYAAFLHSAQHHGYPTPLLDWSWSPYVAAFFAYNKIDKHRNFEETDKVRIFKFHTRGWDRRWGHADKLFPFPPNVSVLSPLAFSNPRVLPQQAICTVSNIDDIETYIQEREEESQQTFLGAFDLPVSERNTVIRELALMGITEGSLFPGLDGACKALKDRNF